MTDDYTRDFHAISGEPREHLIRTYGRSMVEKAMELAKAEAQAADADLVPYIKRAIEAREAVEVERLASEQR